MRTWCTMSSYAPLFAHVDAWQWTPNLIWFDNLRSFGTPNYYVQKLFGTNRGTHVLRVDANGSEKNAAERALHQRFTRSEDGEVILKAVNTTPAARTLRVDLKGVAGIRGDGRLTVLASADLKAENSLEQPKRVVADGEACRRGVRWLRSDAGAAVGYGAESEVCDVWRRGFSPDRGPEGRRPQRNKGGAEAPPYM